MLERLHTFIRDVARRERSGFVKAETITEAINSASSDLWRAKIKEITMGNELGDDWVLQPFKGKQSITSAGNYTITNGSAYVLTSIESEDGFPEIVIARNDREFKNIRSSSELAHILKADHSFTLNAASSGKEDLPDDLFKVGQVFYHSYNGNQYEGQILEDREFLDRKNSAIVPPSEELPIARIHDDQIEIFPAPTGSDTFTFSLPYIKFNPIARYYPSGANLVVEFKPESFSLDVDAWFYRPPALAAATYGAPVNGVQSITVAQDLEWDEQVFPEIATRALTYVGITINNQIVAQLESIVEQQNQVDSND